MDIEIIMEDGGVIKAELYPAMAPITVANFVKLIEQNFFDGLIFHRVISGFMIQGGGMSGIVKICAVEIHPKFFRLLWLQSL